MSSSADFMGKGFSSLYSFVCCILSYRILLFWREKHSNIICHVQCFEFDAFEHVSIAEMEQMHLIKTHWMNKVKKTEVAVGACMCHMCFSMHSCVKVYLFWHDIPPCSLHCCWKHFAWAIFQPSSDETSHQLVCAPLEIIVIIYLQFWRKQLS